MFNVVQNIVMQPEQRSMGTGTCISEWGLPWPSIHGSRAASIASKINVLHVLDMSPELNKQTAGDWDISIEHNFPTARIRVPGRQTGMYQRLSCPPPFLCTWSVPDRSQRLGCIKGRMDWRLSSWHRHGLIYIRLVFFFFIIFGQITIANKHLSKRLS